MSDYAKGAVVACEPCPCYRCRQCPCDCSGEHWHPCLERELRSAELQQIIEDSDTAREALSAIAYRMFPNAKHDWVALQLESIQRCEDTLRRLAAS